MKVNGGFLFSIGRYSLILEISSFNKNLRGDKFKMAAQCYQTNQLSMNTKFSGYFLYHFTQSFTTIDWCVEKKHLQVMTDLEKNL